MKDKNQNESGADDGQKSHRRMTINAARRMLGMLGRNYTDEDLAEALNVLYGLAEEGFEIYREIGLGGNMDGSNIDDSDE